MVDKCKDLWVEAMVAPLDCLVDLWVVAVMLQESVALLEPEAKLQCLEK
jgi:hypothetical protein